MQELTDQNFDQNVLNSDIPVIVDFGADWCVPCKKIEPILHDIAKEYQGVVRVVEVNVDNFPQIAMKYGVRSVPSILFFKGGLVIDQVIGSVTKNTMLKKVQGILE
jgi:thioredoxin 1